MDISCVIPTIGRDDTLSRALASVLDQVVDAHFQVIVVNDSGQNLQTAGWMDDSRVTVVNTNHVERCFARNVGASLAEGKWLHFLDDDDCLLPQAYGALIDLARDSGASWVYGAYNCTDDGGKLIQTIRPFLEGDIFAYAVADIGIPMGGSLISREVFLSVGGFDPVLIPGEDRDLIQRLSVVGEFASCQQVVASFRVGSGTTTSTPWSRSALNGRLMREKRFADPRCLPRILESVPKTERSSSVATAFGALLRSVGRKAHSLCSPHWCESCFDRPSVCRNGLSERTVLQGRIW
jgi:glycosyltransferase involved in cell wall biosynthesis